MTSSAVPLVEELIPCPDPWDVARKLAHLPHLLFLDSSDRSTDRGRYSYVMADPVEFSYGVNTDEVIVDYEPGYTGPIYGPLEYEEQLLKDRYQTEEHLPPFQGGRAGLLNYELGRQFEERVPRVRRSEFISHTSELGFYDTVISFDHQQGRAWIVSSGLPRYHRKDRKSVV